MRNFDIDERHGPPRSDPESPGWVDPHPPKKASDLLGDMSFVPTCPTPDLRKQTCELCALEFLSRPQWFGAKWHYPNICIHCSDNYSHREELQNAHRPRIELINNPGPKTFYCSKCRRAVKISAIKDGLYWLYEGTCKHCGTSFENLYYAYKAKPKQSASSQDKNLDDID